MVEPIPVAPCLRDVSSTAELGLPKHVQENVDRFHFQLLIGGRACDQPSM